VWGGVFTVHECSHLGEACEFIREVLRELRVSMYTAIAQTSAINIPASLLRSSTQQAPRRDLINTISFARIIINTLAIYAQTMSSYLSILH